MAKYQIYGPFEVPRTRVGGLVDKEKLSNFWNEIEVAQPGLSQAKGCYLFAVRAARGIRPWYVGKTEADYGFQGEAFDHHKLTHYNEVVNEQGAGVPVLFLIARRTRTDQAFKQRDPFALYLERLLIMYALRANDELKNTKDAAFFRNASIPGLLNPGKGRIPPSARKLLVTLNRLHTKTKAKPTIDSASAVSDNDLASAPTGDPGRGGHEASIDLTTTENSSKSFGFASFLFGGLSGAGLMFAYTQGYITNLLEIFS